MKSPKDWLYHLLKGQHIERWSHFERFKTLERLRIVMFVVNHRNHARMRDIIENLTGAGDERTHETLARLIRYMKEERFLSEDGLGFLSVTKPSKMHFIIKQLRGNLEDSWFLIALAVSVSTFIIEVVERGFGVISLFLLLIAVLIGAKIIDDALHETTW